MIFRNARHTNQLELLKEFYTTILGLEVLGEFQNHDEYDGIFLGLPNYNWHLEFTTSAEKVNHKFDEDDCLVFYPTSVSNYEEIISKIKSKSIKLEIPKNPYWKENGIAIKDPDGFIIIISKQKIS